MHLSEVEIFVFKKGLLGVSLAEVPENLIPQIEKSSILEIIRKEDNKVPNCLYKIGDPPQSFKLSELSSYDDYVIRFTIESFRRLAFLGHNSKSVSMALYVTILLQNPKGMTRKQAKSYVIPGYGILKQATKSIVHWINPLRDLNIVHTAPVGKDELVVYNLDFVDGKKELPDDFFTSKEYALYVEHSKLRTPLSAWPKEEVVNHKPMKLSEEFLEKIFGFLRQTRESVEFKEIRRKFSLTTNELAVLIDEIKKSKDFELDHSDKPTSVVWLGGLSTEFYDQNMINFLIDTCKAYKVFCTIDPPTDIKKIKTTMGLTTKRILSILEDNNFNIVEIRSKYVESVFVVFSSSVSSDDEDILVEIENAKLKVMDLYRKKIKQVFLKNVYLNSFDNNYLVSDRERFTIFYEFIMSSMKANKGYFYLNKHALLSMNFVSFIKIIPLRSEYQFMRLCHELGKESKEIAKAFGKASIKDIEDWSADVFCMINDKLLKVLNTFTVRDILRLLETNSSSYAHLISRLNLYELDTLLFTLTRLDIFNGLVTDEYIYFESKNINKEQLAHSLESLKEGPGNHNAAIVSYKDRKNFFDLVCGLSQDEFYQTAFEIISQMDDKTQSKFFMDRLQSFEKAAIYK